MSGKYEIYTGKNNQFYFRLKAGNGEVILASEGYTSKANCENGIESVRKNSPDDQRYERLTAQDGSPYFNLKAANHQVIGRSETYSSSQARENGIASVKKNGPHSIVFDITE
ncbi:YegP family protein [Brenneria izbisi]|uniref:YegP family protein n=1 Tax=Brenneria izbisi TaxID=2939450 RepID=A0AA42C4F5_9GAMM|nr:YegP family protein [Brenneria izbisi]MCV9878214.1 YegP family protein [Brenneria izbisi]MCV9881222.1 YegP family protein [Brenneria izbisi]